jgi:hypothetical protein
MRERPHLEALNDSALFAALRVDLDTVVWPMASIRRSSAARRHAASKFALGGGSRLS